MTMVTSTGFEPVNAALRGLRLKPLVDEAIWLKHYSGKWFVNQANNEKVFEYDIESYYFDTFVKDDGLFTTYVRTTTYTLYGKGRFEGEYELPTEKTYKINNETGEEIFE